MLCILSSTRMDRCIFKQLCTMLTLTIMAQGKGIIENRVVKAGHAIIHNDTDIVSTYVDISIAVCTGLCALKPACIMAEYKYTTKFCKLLSGSLQIQRKPGFYVMNKDEFSKEPSSGYSLQFREATCQVNDTNQRTRSFCESTECVNPGVCTGCTVLGNMYNNGSKVMFIWETYTFSIMCSETGNWYHISSGTAINDQLTCGEIQSNYYGLSSGVYRNKFGVLLSCDLDSDGGRWTVFQRRFNGSVNFYRNWNDYENGFGDLEGNGEFWLGLKPLAQILHGSVSTFELRIDLVAWNGEQGYALYENFNLSSVTDNYRLSVGKYSGNVGDALGESSFSHTYNNHQMFSTHDRDNDLNPDSNCAIDYGGAWWFNGCFNAHLNGPYPYNETAFGVRAMIWKQWKGYNKSVKESSMKVREMQRSANNN